MKIFKCDVCKKNIDPDIVCELLAIAEQYRPEGVNEFCRDCEIKMVDFLSVEIKKTTQIINEKVREFLINLAKEKQ